MANPNDPCIISVGITGSGTTLAQNPNLPCTPQQIAQAAIESWRAGAAICHFHVRNPDGTPTHDLGMYSEIMQRVRAETNLVINFTTGGFLGMSHAERQETVTLRPDMASYNAGSLNFGEHVYQNPTGWLEPLADQFKEYGVKPELELFDTGMIPYCLQLAQQGLLDNPLWFQFVLGVRWGMTATPETLLYVTKMLPPDANWSVIGVGRAQVPMNALGILLGGHVRTGLEDNVYYKRGELASSNAQLTERVARLVRELGREVATPADARRIIGMQSPA